MVDDFTLILLRTGRLLTFHNPSVLEPRTKNFRIASIYHLAPTNHCCWSTAQIRVTGTWGQCSKIKKFLISIMGVENSERIMVLQAIGRICPLEAHNNLPYDRFRMRRGSLTRTLHCIPSTLNIPQRVFLAYSGTGHGIAVRVGRDLCIHVPHDEHENKSRTKEGTSPLDWRYLSHNADRNLGRIESFDAETGVLVMHWGVSGSRVYTFV
jgi:hypothetical protein